MDKLRYSRAVRFLDRMAGRGIIPRYLGEHTKTGKPEVEWINEGYMMADEAAIARAFNDEIGDILKRGV